MHASHPRHYTARELTLYAVGVSPSCTDTLADAISDGICVVDGDVDFSIVDNGIGAYEYWGSRGVHHSFEPEVTSEASGEFVVDFTEVGVPEGLDEVGVVKTTGLTLYRTDFEFEVEVTYEIISLTLEVDVHDVEVNGRPGPVVISTGTATIRWLVHAT